MVTGATNNDVVREAKDLPTYFQIRWGTLNAVAVMYAGKIVENGSVRDIFNNPPHSYTEALLGSVPKLEEDVERLYAIEGQPPAPHDLPQGCSFADRCPYVMEKYRQEYPAEITAAAGHFAACWRLV